MAKFDAVAANVRRELSFPACGSRQRVPARRHAHGHFLHQVGIPADLRRADMVPGYGRIFSHQEWRAWADSTDRCSCERQIARQ